MANGILDALNRRLFSGPAMDTYTRDYQKSLSAPTTFDYNIASNKAAGQFIQDKTKELLGDNRISNVIGQAGTYAAVPLAFMSSPFYEGFQVARDKMEPGSGVKGFFDAYAQERPFATPVERAAGVLQSTPLGEAIYNLGGKAADLVSGIRNTNIGDFFFAPAGAADFRDGEMLQAPTRSIRGDYTRAPNTAFADLLSDDDEFEAMLAEATRRGEGQSFLSRVAEFLPGGPRSLSGGITRGIGSIIRNIAPASYGTSGRFYNSLTPQGKAAVNQIYGSGGIMSGYNPVSAFGRGAVGAIDNRLNRLATRRAPQTAASRQRAKDLFAAREKIMQTTLDSDNRYTGPKASPRGQKKGVMDDDPFGGTSGTTGGGSKIVCTMMNESYGFGNFRNKIWLKHSKDLPKEYEIGYHTIFLPLVKFAKGKGKLNKVVKKTLEHVARHRTLDLKQEMKGKTHTLGRVYRKILEPICLIVGKIKKWQK